MLFKALGLKKFSIYVQDYGAPVGYRIASRHQDAIEGIVAQNGNAYAEGIGPAFDPMKPFWANRNPETEKPVRELLKKETTIFQYTHGVKDVSRISPDSYTVDQLFLDRPGNDAIQLNLLHNYQSNLALYDGWHEFFRTRQPKTLIVWGKNDPFFTVEGATGLPARHSESGAAPARYRPLRARGSLRIHRAANLKVSGVIETQTVLHLAHCATKRIRIMSFTEKATVVVVHGAWADGSSWQAVMGPLAERGLNVIAAPIPLTSLSDDAAALKRTIARTEGPLIVAGHAYAGAVIATSQR